MYARTMRLESISIRNFRLLRRVSLDLTSDRPTTVFVGPNNSGKTSVMDALRLFAGSDADNKRISFHDLSQSRLKTLKTIEARIAATTDSDAKIEILIRFAPRMRMDLTFSHGEDAADLVVASDLLMDLNPVRNRIRLRVEYRLENAKALLVDFEARRRKEDSLHDFLTERYRDYFGRTFFKVAENGNEAEALKDTGVLKRLLRIDVIPAQRHVDDEESRQAAKLSRLLHDHYTRYYKVGDEKGFHAVEDALKDSARGLTEVYKAAFERLNKRLKGYGYPPGQSTPDLRIRAEFSSQTIYQDHTRVYYANEYSSTEGTKEEFVLPEKYNGLGYKNLIFIVLQIESFLAAVEATPVDRPRVHVIAVEEPEAHLHPQMQHVFIQEISKSLESTEGVVAQVILSTHSSHIIANSGFDPVRYFRRVHREVAVRDLSKLPIGDVLRKLQSVIRLPDDLEAALNPPPLPEDAESSEARFIVFLAKLVKIPYLEVMRYRAVFDEHLPYSTKHGVKGDEFENVIVILDDAGANWNQYAFGKLLSGADTSESRFKRTRNLFYVCCSRARVNLAVVNLAPMGDAAPRIKELFGAQFVAG